VFVAVTRAEPSIPAVARRKAGFVQLGYFGIRILVILLRKMALIFYAEILDIRASS
jgi:hypothetical protein